MEAEFIQVLYQSIAIKHFERNKAGLPITRVFYLRYYSNLNLKYGNQLYKNTWTEVIIDFQQSNRRRLQGQSLQLHTK